jgi:hypothetical protein
MEKASRCAMHFSWEPRWHIDESDSLSCAELWHHLLGMGRPFVQRPWQPSSNAERIRCAMVSSISREGHGYSRYIVDDFER